MAQCQCRTLVDLENRKEDGDAAETPVSAAHIDDGLGFGVGFGS